MSEMPNIQRHLGEGYRLIVVPGPDKGTFHARVQIGNHTADSRNSIGGSIEESLARLEKYLADK